MDCKSAEQNTGNETTMEDEAGILGLNHNFYDHVIFFLKFTRNNTCKIEACFKYK